MTVYRYVLELETRSLCIAPKHARSYLQYIISRFNLVQKYGPDATHVDRVFDRIWCPHCGKWLPGYDGWRLKSVLNYNLSLRNVVNMVCYGIFGDEHSVVLLKKSITTSNGERTLITYEAFGQGTVLHAVFDIYERPIDSKSPNDGRSVIVTPEMIEERLRKLIGRELVLRGLRSRGFNRVVLVNYARSCI